MNHCHICGEAAENPKPFTYQGYQTVLCFVCWEMLMGCGDEDNPDPDWEDD